MSCYCHLTIEEREKLYGFLQKEISIRQIAKELKRSPSTICRELKRNPGYLPIHAQHRYAQNRKRCVRKLILADPQTEQTVRFFLSYLYWSPEQISYRLKMEGCLTVSTSTIYRALEKGLLRDSLRFYLRFKYHTHGKNKEPAKRCFSRIIDDRPPEANERRECGHWEGDTIVSSKSRTVIATLVDRKSRFLVAGRIKSKEASEMRRVVVKLLHKTPRPVKSITFDQGTEFADAAHIESDLNTLVFFAHPHAPWERPTNENTNGLLRQFIPKHKDIGELSDEDISRFVALLNLRPRKCLNWSTPFEVFSEQLLHFT